MGQFDDFDLEIQDDKERGTEHYNGTVTTAGVPVTVSTINNNTIQYTYVYNPTRGPNANSPGDMLYISWDGGTTYTTLPRGSSIMWPGKGSGSSGESITIDSNVDGVKYEVMLVACPV